MISEKGGREAARRMRRAYMEYARVRAMAGGRPAAKGLSDGQAGQALFEELYLRGRFARRNLHEMRSLVEKLRERSGGTMPRAGSGS